MAKPPPMSSSNKAGFVLLVVFVVGAVAVSQCGKNKHQLPEPSPTMSTTLRTAVQK
jgi:hypothetical protein